MIKDLLLSTNCLEPGHCDSHSSDTRTLSNLLLVIPLGLYQVNFLPTTGISFSMHLSINSLNLVMSQLFTIPLFKPFLSEAFLTELKSPITHLIHQFAVANLSSTSFHSKTLSLLEQGP